MSPMTQGDPHLFAHDKCIIHRLDIWRSGRVGCLEVTDVTQAEAMHARRRLSMALVAGLGTGVVGALGSVVAQLGLGVRFPLLSDTAWSAFFAGPAGGLLYAVLVGAVRRPVSVLWILSLGIATLDSLLIALLPLPAGPGLKVGIPIDGLIIPIEQLGALLGFGRLGTTHFPVMLLPADTLLHYIPALAVAVLVPWLFGWSSRPASARRRTRPSADATWPRLP